MEIKCPECGQDLVVHANGQSAECPTHGAFQLQYDETAAPPPVPADSNAPPVITETGRSARMCANHPHLAATFVCSDCGAFICTICSRPQPNGTWICQSCADKKPGALPPPIPLAGRRCVQHSTVAATRLCKLCSAPMCPVCDFLLPGNVHLCPKCVIAPKRPMSTGRKQLLIAAYVFAVWNTGGIMVFFSGVLRSFGKSDLAMLGLIVSLFIYLPSIIGTALGVSTLDKRLSNPPVVWGAAIWNSIITAIHFLLIILGNLK